MITHKSGTKLVMSRWDEMMVARHEMPGKVASRSPSRRVRNDRSASGVQNAYAALASGVGFNPKRFCCERVKI
jgi:hypothetical protein